MGIRKELQSDLYRDAAQKYKDKIIMLKTTELATGDLEKYYKALDKYVLCWALKVLYVLFKTR